MKNNFKIERIFAFQIFCLLTVFFTQTAHSASDLTASKDVDTVHEYVIPGENIFESCADIEAEQEESDTHFIIRFHNNDVNKNIVIPFAYTSYKGTQLLSLLIFIFQTDLPPPFLFSKKD